jgi:hypothetical protein
MKQHRGLIVVMIDETKGFVRKDLLTCAMAQGMPNSTSEYLGGMCRRELYTSSTCEPSSATFHANMLYPVRQSECLREIPGATRKATRLERRDDMCMQQKRVCERE